MRDKKGREIMAGDILRVFHFRYYQRRETVYMYKVVMRVNNQLELDPTGEHLYAVCIEDLARHCVTKDAHKCRLDVMDPQDVEIVAGGRVTDGTWFLERPRQKT